jgi:hypothetical protein
MADRYKSRLKEGHHVGGLAVTSKGDFREVMRNQKKGKRLNRTTGTK